MAQTLDYNKEVTTVVPVDIPAFDDDLAIIQKLDDEPNDVGGLTAAELKAEFDKSGLNAQKYINEKLIPKIIADDLTEQSRQAAEAERVANEQERVSETEGVVARASEKATLAQSWAIGGTGSRTGENTDNAKYWAKQANLAAGGGVSSFNGRAGFVMPAAGDYTAAMVGAAQAGFGYGETLTQVRVASADESYDDYCAKIDAVLATMGNNYVKQIAAYPPAIYGKGSQLAVLYKANEEYVCLIGLGGYDADFHGWRMVKFNGVWQPFEWVNPPMQLNTEYRTTERFRGKPVYAMLAAFGSNINGASVYFGENVHRVVRGIAYDANFNPYPAYNGFEQNAWTAMFDFSHAADPTDNIVKVKVTCHSGTSMSGAYMYNYVAIYYTKTTD